MGKFPRKSYDAQKDLSDSLLLSLSCCRAVDTCQNHQGIVVLQQLLWAETTDELPQDQISKLKRFYYLVESFSAVLTEMCCGVKTIFPTARGLLMHFARLAL